MPVPSFSANALRVLERRYLRKDGAGRLLETPGEMLARVAHAVAAAEASYGQAPERAEARFLEALERLEFLPNSPTLMNAGRDLGQLSACFVLPVLDSLPEIFEAVKWAALIQQTGGGTGFAFSRLRPAGDVVASTNGVASGPVSFIEVFNAATDAIRQGGVRRGANMAILKVDHPDILEFVAAKADPKRLRNFNVSVAITQEFMRAVETGGDYALRSPRSGAVVKRLDARRVWELIARLAWKSGEPGVVFIDRINAENPTPQLGEMESTNPCGELPLLPFESCNLGSIDVSKFVVAGGSRFDWERLADRVHLGIRFLDDVIDVNRYPLPQIEEITRKNRKVGLGVMGFADALLGLGVPYDSGLALEIGDQLMGFVAREAESASAELARERGPFANFSGSRWDRPGARPVRNATTTTIAPTGTISILAGCSGGIEPLYALSFVRRVLDGERLLEVHPLFVEAAKRGGFFSPALAEAIAERGSCAGLAEVPEATQRLFKTAYDIAPEWHVRMQATFQRHVHNSVSKTINFPERATVEDVLGAYGLAYELGCKGITVYRDGSRDAQVLSFGAARAGASVGAGSGSGSGSVDEALDGEEACPECGDRIAPAHQGACTVCLECGFSRCL